MLHSFAAQYPRIADQLLLNSAESYPALFGEITAPIRQDRVSAACGHIGLHSFTEQYPHIADQLLPNLAELYPALFGKITAPIRQDRVSAARGPIGLHSFAEQYPHIADQLMLNSAEIELINVIADEKIRQITRISKYLSDFQYQ